MKKRTIVVFSIIALACSVAIAALWVGNTNNPSKISTSEKTGQSSGDSMEDLADEYADKSLSQEQVSEDLDKLVQNKTLTVEEANWLKARIAEIRDAASSQQTPIQPGTLEEYIQYYADYDRQLLNDIKTAQKLYDQYSQNQGSNAPITQSTLQALNQAKLMESINILHIDTEINQLMLNGTITTEQGTWLKERVHQLRTP